MCMDGQGWACLEHVLVFDKDSPLRAPRCLQVAERVGIRGYSFYAHKRIRKPRLCGSLPPYKSTASTCVGAALAEWIVVDCGGRAFGSQSRDHVCRPVSTGEEEHEIRPK